MRYLVSMLVLTGWLSSLPGAAHAQASPAIGVDEVILDNGLKVLLLKTPSPAVTFQVWYRAGARYDPPGREGLANLTADLLTYGTLRRSAVEITDELDFIGARLAVQCARDVTTLTLTVLKKDLETGLRLLADFLIEASFPPLEVERRKRFVVAQIRSKEENPGEIARDVFRAALFPRSPYGRRVNGDRDSVQAMGRNDIVEFYRARYRPNNAVLAAAGDFSHEEIVTGVNSALGPWIKGPIPEELPPPPPPTNGRTIRIQKKLAQANIVMGHAGVPRSHPDFYPLYVMNHIFGGAGLASRLADAIRNERGLAYSVQSVMNARKILGTFRIAVQTKNETAGEAMEITHREMKRLRTEEATARELRDAKDYLIGSFPLSLDTNRGVARLLTRMEYLQLGLDYVHRYPELIEEVTREDVLRTARTHLHPDRLTVVVVGDLEKIK